MLFFVGVCCFLKNNKKTTAKNNAFLISITIILQMRGQYGNSAAL